MKKLEGQIYCIDFDGTCVTHDFPIVGKDAPHAERVLKKMVSSGAKLILWTMRDKKYLQDAVDWFKEKEIPLWAIQQNPEQHSWTTSPKAYCHNYIDDIALGCPLLTENHSRPYVDWLKIEKLLF